MMHTKEICRFAGARNAPLQVGFAAFYCKCGGFMQYNGSRIILSSWGDCIVSERADTRVCTYKIAYAFSFTAAMY